MDLGGRAAGRRVAAATLIAAAALALCACDGADPPVVTETPVPSVSATPSLSPSPSPSPAATLSAEELLALIPEESQWMNAEGAIATAEFYVGLLGEIFTTEDTRVWASLATDECLYCASQVENVAELAASDWHAEGGEVTVLSEQTEGAIGDDAFGYVRITAEVEELFSVNAQGDREIADAGGTLTFALQMTANDGIWRVNGMRIEE